MSRVVYSPVMNRWYNYFDEKLPKSSVFLEGYDDPTYHTFRVEFGDWGASVLDPAVMNMGITNYGI